MKKTMDKVIIEKIKKLNNLRNGRKNKFEKKIP
jgi:hypothetical protein